MLIGTFLTLPPHRPLTGPTGQPFGVEMSDLIIVRSHGNGMTLTRGRKTPNRWYTRFARCWCISYLMNPYRDPCALQIGRMRRGLLKSHISIYSIVGRCVRLSLCLLYVRDISKDPQQCVAPPNSCDILSAGPVIDLSLPLAQFHF